MKFLGYPQSCCRIGIYCGWLLAVTASALVVFPITAKVAAACFQVELDQIFRFRCPRQCGIDLCQDFLVTLDTLFPG